MFQHLFGAVTSVHVILVVNLKCKFNEQHTIVRALQYQRTRTEQASVGIITQT